MNRTLIIILVIIAIIVILIVAKKVKSNLDAIKARKSYEGSLVDMGNGSFNARMVAETVYNAMHNDCIFGMCEEDGKVVEALLPIPKQFIKQVTAEYYKVDNSKLVMPLDLQKLMDAENWNKIKYLFV